jgi:hypothetical protein
MSVGSAPYKTKALQEKGGKGRKGEREGEKGRRERG